MMFQQDTKNESRGERQKSPITTTARLTVALLRIIVFLRVSSWINTRRVLSTSWQLVGLGILLITILPSIVAAQTAPKPLGPVSDYAGKLSPQARSRIETTLNDFRTRSGGIEIAVVTIPRDQLGGLPIEDYTLRLGREWGVGGGSEKAGLLLVVAIGAQEASGNYRGDTRLEVSRRLEGDLPDALAGQIITQMRTDLRAGRFDQAIGTAVDSIVSIISQRRGIAGGQTQSQPSSGLPRGRPAPGRTGSGFGAIVWVLVLLAIVGTIIVLAIRGVATRSSSRRGRDRWSRAGRRRGHDSDWVIWPIFFGGGGSGGFGGWGGSSGSSESGGGFSDSGGSSGGSESGGFSDSGGISDSGGGGDWGGFSGGGDFGGGGASDSW